MPSIERKHVVQVVTVEASQKRRDSDIPGSVHLRIVGSTSEGAINLTPDEARELAGHLAACAVEAETEAPARRINLD